jgi:hypothetical protein
MKGMGKEYNRKGNGNKCMKIFIKNKESSP